MKIALAITYLGSKYHGWQSQPDGNTVQDVLEKALNQFAPQNSGKITTLCAGRTDAGVHGLMQIVHFETNIQRAPFSWIRGVNHFLPDDIAVQWAGQVPDEFHARAKAISRRYCYIVVESPVRPSIEAGRVGWSFKQLDEGMMKQAAQHFLGEHDFTSFRAAACQALSPIKTLTKLEITKRGAYWRFDFEANAFLHHMIRNIMGCMIAVGQGNKPPEWIKEVIKAKSRDAAAPTYSPDGLYFLGPTYEEKWGIPREIATFASLPL